MLGVKLICVGKLKEAYWRDAVAEYEKRLRSLCKWELIELPEARLPSEPSQGEIDAALEKEGEQILRHAVGTIYPLCIEGKLLDSPGLAKRLAGAMQSPGAVSFVIGSSFGLSPKVKDVYKRQLRNLQDEFDWALEDLELPDTPRKVTIPTGEGAFAFLDHLLDGLREKCHNITIELLPVKNDFFGGSINVTGLLTGQDILKNLKGRDLGCLLYTSRAT